MREASENAFAHSLAGRSNSRLALAATVSSALAECLENRSNETIDASLRSDMIAALDTGMSPLDLAALLVAAITRPSGAPSDEAALLKSMLRWREFLNKHHIL